MTKHETWCHLGMGFRLQFFTIFSASRNSSVGRALDWRSKGPWFDPGFRQYAPAAGQHFFLSFFPHWDSLAPFNKWYGAKLIFFFIYHLKIDVGIVLKLIMSIKTIAKFYFVHWWGSVSSRAAHSTSKVADCSILGLNWRLEGVKSVDRKI